MSNWLTLGHHHHSGRLRPHEHTSYFPLAILLFVVGVLLTAFSVTVASPGPESGSVGLTGTMPGPAPTVAATIQIPKNGQHFSATPITISGTCPKNTLVEIFKNDIFAGSTACSDKGTYSLEVDLLIGQNTVVARVYDSLNQPGPDSNIVTVFYDALASQGSPVKSLDFGGAQLLLNTDAVYRGVFPEKEFTIPIDILGGKPPYAVNIQWGDSTNKIVPRNDNVTFRTPHVYQKPGIYQISLQGSDSEGRVAFLTVAAIVNGQPPIAPAAGSTSPVNKLLVLWPLYAAAIAIVISFWLGERREKRVLASHGLLINPAS
jgi:hypothetical protein